MPRCCAIAQCRVPRRLRMPRPPGRETVARGTSSPGARANPEGEHGMEITIYHNPDCGTSRNALVAIRAAGHEPRIFEYLKTPLSRGAIAALANRMNVSV